jgi:hypothetical protein
MNGFNGTTEKTIGALVKELAEDLSTLVRSEIALAKLELKQSMMTLTGASAMFIAAVFCAIFGAAFLFVTAVLGLVVLGVPAWLSTLIVALVLLIAAVTLALLGKSKVSKLNFVPTETMNSVKNDLATIKGDLARLRQRTS